MTDREKVIKGLEMCIKDIECTGCPYENDCFAQDGNPFGTSMMRDALALIKEQEAVSIEWKYGFPHCPVCGQMLPEGDAVKYCLHCGRSVLWE